MSGTLNLLHRPKYEPLREQDVDWPAVYQRTDFQMLGLCNRHVQIDNTGRDWYGLPLLVDPVAAPVQGIPYIKQFDTYHEKELNDLLWALHYLTLRGESPVEQARYTIYCKERQPGEEALTLAAWYEREVELRIKVGIYPSTRVALQFLPRETDEEYAAAEAAAEAKGHRYSSHYERFISLDLVGKVAFGLEGLIRSIRQSMFFDKLAREHHSEQVRGQNERTAISQAKFAPIEKAREAQRLERLRQRRAGIQLEPVEVIQTTIFQAA